jgi:hypothetical protein
MSMQALDDDQVLACLMRVRGQEDFSHAASPERGDDPAIIQVVERLFGGRFEDPRC